MDKAESKKEVIDTLRGYAESILSIESYLLGTLDSNLKQLSSTLAKEELAHVNTVLRATKETLEKQVNELNTLIDTLDGGRMVVLKETVSSATATISGLFSRMRSEPISRLMRDTYTGLCALSCGYTMLYTSALAVDEKKISEVAIKRLKELTPLVVHLSDALPFAIVSELDLEAASHDPEIAELAKVGAKGAWDGDHVGQSLLAQ